jgi:alpha-ketoglutarate-dependent 2,4-dichlorophenoxyacetate dioxygenase
LDDTSHVNFSRRFGELDDIRPYVTNGRKPRYNYFELFDAGNVDGEGNVLPADNPRTHYGKGNGFFHVDSSFNPRRASYSLLRAAKLPPPNTGGNTEFADTRTAFETLPEKLKQRLIENDYIGAHSLHHSRKRGSPDFFAKLNPLDFKMHKHRIAQLHEPSGRMNLYIGAHLHNIQGLSDLESWQLIWSLIGWATRPENTVSVEWKNEGDLIIWDNTAVMHRAAGGSYEHKFARDLRRTTVHDASSTAWGLNGKEDRRPGFDVAGGKEQTDVARLVQSMH